MCFLHFNSQLYMLKQSGFHLSDANKVFIVKFSRKHLPITVEFSKTQQTIEHWRKSDEMLNFSYFSLFYF